MSGDEKPIKFYFSSTSGNMQIVSRQNKIQQVFDAKKIDHVKIDIAGSEDAKQKMREAMGCPTGVAPQICNGEQYCGDFEMFEEAVEEGKLEEFLKLTTTQQQQEN